MIAGLEPLLKMRRTGRKPAGLVFLNVCPQEPRGCRDWHRWGDTAARPELWIKPGTHPALLDLGALVGLHVLMHADHWTEWLAGVWDALIEQQPVSAMLAVADFGDDVGYVWTPEHGQRCIGDPLPATSDDVLILAGDRGEAIDWATRRGVGNLSIVHVEDERGIRELGEGRTLHVLPGAQRRANFRTLIDRAAWKFDIRHEEAS